MNNTIDLALELEKLFAGNSVAYGKQFDLAKELVAKMDNMITLEELLPLEMRDSIKYEEGIEIPFELVS